MQVSCPSCSTAYEIPPPVRPRRLRCARCDTEWRALPPEPTDADEAGPEADAVASAPPPVPEQLQPEPGPIEPVPPPAPLPPATTDALRPPVPAGRSAGRSNDAVWWMLAWVASLVLIGAVSFACWHGRVWIAQDWPQSLRLFRLLPGGVPV